MRALLTFLLLSSLSLSSCNKQGCRDIDALNFDASADKNGACRYSKVIFYATSDRIGGTADKIVKIEIFLGPRPGEELIGAIMGFDQSIPVNCVAPAGAFEYELPGSGLDYIFLTRYYYENGTNENGDHFLRKADSETECYTIQLTL